MGGGGATQGQGYAQQTPWDQYGNYLQPLLNGPVAGTPVASHNPPAMMAPPNVQSMYPLKKPGLPWDPNTDWYGYPDKTINAQIQFPPPQMSGAAYKMF